MARTRPTTKYQARLAKSESEVDRCVRFRTRVFRPESWETDRDGYDARCEHILVEKVEDQDIICCFRFLFVEDGSEIDKSYSAQFYELSALKEFDRPMVEMGRFCIDPTYRDPDVFRVAWGAMADVVQSRKAELLFGCSSFQGTEPALYHDAFAILRDRHIAPKRWLPRMKSPRVFEFARRLRRKADPKAAMRVMPPLLKTYLAMGGWVSDHAVVDRDLDTLHVFTGVEISTIPAARRRSILSDT